MKKLIIAIDGPVGSGKSTLARRVAELMDYVYIDTGAMYRALALKALRRGPGFDREEDLETLARDTRIDLKRAERNAARVSRRRRCDGLRFGAPEVSQAASKIAVVSGVRHVLVAEQRRAGQQGGVVMEGRDIGSVVFRCRLEDLSDGVAGRCARIAVVSEHQQKGDSIDRRARCDEIHQRDQRDRERPRRRWFVHRMRGGGQQRRWKRRKWRGWW